MKVVFATGIFPPDIGGPATYVDGLARELSRSSRAVEVVSYGDGEGGGSETPFPVTRVSRKQSLPFRYGSYFRAVRRSLSSDAIAYMQDPVSSGFPGILAAQSKGRPAVLKVVGDLAWEIGREQGHVDVEIEAFQQGSYSGLVGALRRAERFVARRARRVVTPSRFLKKIVAGWGVDPEKIDVVRNSVRAPEGTLPAREEARRSLGVSGEPLLLTAGRMAPWKGFDVLIEAMPEVLRHHPRAHLLIVGRGPREEDLRRQVDAAGLEGSVSFPGGVDARQMALHLRAADVFLLASTYEGLSHVLLEAMLEGLPSVASNAGGNPELVEDGESGLLAAPDTAGMTEGILRMIGDPSLMEKLSRNARERAASFRWETMVSETLAILTEVADG